MKCNEIDEAYAPISQTAAKNNASQKTPQAQVKPLSPVDLDAAEAEAKRQKLRNMAAVMQAKKLNSARTQATTDDIAMAFRLANS